MDNRHKACRRACLDKAAFGHPEQDREGIALVRTRREEWMSGRAECLALSLRLQASHRYRKDMAPTLVPPLVPSAAYVVRFLGS